MLTSRKIRPLRNRVSEKAKSFCEMIAMLLLLVNYKQRSDSGREGRFMTETSRDRPKSAPYPKLKNSKKTSKCQVLFYSTRK